MEKIDRLIRSKRKSIGLEIKPDGTLVVRAPVGVNLRAIQQVVDSKADWIKQTRAKMRDVQNETLTHTFEEGDLFLYLGCTYPLRRPNEAGRQVRFDGSNFILPASVSDPAQTLERWYRQAARAHLTALVEMWSKRIEVTYTTLRISAARTRWGSCSTRGTLSFPWRLVMAPPDQVEYVVIHELVHRLHPNHSPAFWSKVAEYVPDYAARRKWFHQYGNTLGF
jgi:predicted metal-dependent hydrolase